MLYFHLCTICFSNFLYMSIDSASEACSLEWDCFYRAAA